MILTKRGIYQAIGYSHPPGNVIAFLKYVPNGKWRGFRRLIKRYAVDEFLAYTKKVFDPAFNATVPIVSISEIIKSPEPWTRAKEIIHRPRDRLEEAFTHLYSLIDAEVGVLGSMLLGIHNPSFSDVDVAIIEPKDPFYVWEQIERMPFGVMVNELEETASRYNLPPRLIASKARRGIFRGIPYSITFIKRSLDRYGRIYKRIGAFEGEVRIVCNERAFYFPHTCTTDVGFYVEVFETALLPLLVNYNEGLFYVRAPVFEVEGKQTLVIGFREMRGFLLPHKAL